MSYTTLNNTHIIFDIDNSDDDVIIQEPNDTLHKSKSNYTPLKRNNQLAAVYTQYSDDDDIEIDESVEVQFNTPQVKRCKHSAIRSRVKDSVDLYVESGVDNVEQNDGSNRDECSSDNYSDVEGTENVHENSVY